MNSHESSPEIAPRQCGSGLPILDHKTIALLKADGNVVVANGSQVTVYKENGDLWRLHCDWKFEHEVTAIADSRAGLLIAAGGRIHCAKHQHIHVAAQVDGVVVSMVAVGMSAHVAVGRPGRLDGSLVEIDLAQSLIISERSLRSSHVALSTDSTASYLGIADGETFRTISLMTAHPCPPANTPDPQRPAPPTPNDPGCPCKCEDGTGDHDPNPNPAADPPSRPAPSDPCDPGTAGVPTPGGGRVVGGGDGVTKHPPGPSRPWDPCRSHLFFQVDRISVAGSYLLVSDQASRNVAVLASEDLQVLHQAQFRKGAVVLSHPTEPRMLIFDRRSSIWSDTSLEEIARFPIDRVPEIDPHVLNEDVTFTGNPLPVLRGTRASAIGIKNVLVLPALDPAQSFNDADLPKLADYLKRTAFSHVEDYYREVSFNKLTNVNFFVYGVNGVGTGGPLRLPKPVAEYYNPPYIGGHIDLIKPGLSFPATLVFDGRESMTLNVQPQTGGRAASTLNVKFCAILAAGSHPLYPAQVQFAGTETGAISVKRPNGSNATLNLVFTPLTINIAGDGELAAKLPQIETYLDGVIAAAETAAGITSRLFKRPVVKRVNQDDHGLGLLVTSITHTATTGAKLEVSSVSYSGTSDPFGLKSAFAGKMTVTAGANLKLQTYLDFVTVLAQEDAGFNVNQRRLATDPVIEAKGSTLTSQIFIVEEDGGPGATISASNIVEMGTLFDSANPIPNTNVTAGRSNTPKDGNDGLSGLLDDVYTAAVDRLAAPGKHLEKKDDINKFFQPYEAVIVIMLNSAKTSTTDPNFVRPSEMWNAGPSSWNGFRAVESPTTAHFRPNPKEIQFFSNWNLLPLEVPPPYLTFCHEFGHALGFGDLYKREAGYRDDLIYMDNWSIMGNDGSGSHHCGYNKWQAGWITDDRVKTLPVPANDTPVPTEVLLVPVEFWQGDSIIAKARTAFSKPGIDVVQLVELDLGGDADVFGLIEARQKGIVHPDGFSWSQTLPAEPALLVTNCIVYWDPTRYAFEHKYRASVHPLHEPNQLRNAGDSFDLARGKEFPAKGIEVSILDRKTIEGVEVFHVKVVRKQSHDFIDMYFSTPPPDAYYKNPDLWVDWAGDNGPGGKTSSSNPNDAHIYPIDEPRDQGEKIRVPDSGNELHWMVARVRNVGNVRAEQVKINFSLCEPPGAGDRGNFKVRDSVLVPVVNPTGRDNPIFVKSAWPIPAGFSGHTCILVEISDLKVPLDATGAALASDDVWQANNKAQKNVDQIGPSHESPFDPVEFDFSVNNSAEWPEMVYLEPEGLPYGMTLTIMPRCRRVMTHETAIFRCTLQLDDKVINASCLGDHDFRINAWRVDEESSVPWGGVEYQVRPRKRSRTGVYGSWDRSNLIEITGNVSPGNITGQVRIRLAYSGLAARWVTADIKPGGTFSYKETAPAGTAELLTMALFEGNKYYSESRSPEKRITPPPPIR